MVLHPLSVLHQGKDHGGLLRIGTTVELKCQDRILYTVLFKTNTTKRTKNHETIPLVPFTDDDD